jgi:hypothetical protein
VDHGSLSNKHISILPLFFPNPFAGSRPLYSGLLSFCPINVGKILVFCANKYLEYRIETSIIVW